MIKRIMNNPLTLFAALMAFSIISFWNGLHA